MNELIGSVPKPVRFCIMIVFMGLAAYLASKVAQNMQAFGDD